MNPRLIALIALLLGFTAYSLMVVAGHGYTGFLELAAREPWGMQILLDLTIALGLFTFWLVPDAKARGIAPWPYVVGIVALGSIGALAYLVHRELAGRDHAAIDARPSR
jgi:protein-S-isoprenylcysteine O-methyltransferase Ste14